MHFSGKGAGAGMMLSSSMGAMGVAIGIAIDEGIAKDIGKAASESNFDIEAIVADVFEDQASKNIEVTIARYGFLTAPSSDRISDPVVPQLHLLVKHQSESPPMAVRIPEGLTGANGCTLTKWELSRIKSSGKLIMEALEQAALCAGSRYSQVIEGDRRN